MPKGYPSNVTLQKKVQALEAQVAQLKSARGGLEASPRGGQERQEVNAGSMMRQVKRPGAMATDSAIHDFLNPLGPETGFQPGDLVMVAESCPKSSTFRLVPDGSRVAKPDEEGIPAIGRVLKYMYFSRKDGMRKYKVVFPHIGRDGLKENELVGV